MDREQELAILDRVMAHRAAGNTTDMAAEMVETPVDAYTSAARYDAEVERLFRGGPILACLSADVAAPGDYVTLSVTDVPVLVVRGEDGVVRAFRNVCRHRGVCVADGRGRTRSFMCPYHGWSYRLDGRLINPTHRLGFAGLDRSTRGLAEMGCDEVAGLVFVHIDGAPGSLDGAAWLSGVADELESFGFARYQRVASRMSTHAMNWKLMGDTFCEQYHLRHLHHSTFAPTVQSDNSLYDVYGRHGRMVTPTHAVAELDDRPRGHWRLLSHVILNYMVVPNAVLLVQDGLVDVFQFLPERPDRTTSLVTRYVAEAPVAEASSQWLCHSFERLLQIIDAEDYEMCEQTQRSFASGAQRALLFGRNEPGLIHYHASIDRLLEEPRRPVTRESAVHLASAAD
jgi:phenylpropionate dioxygenase-like ring-hydroxylating dioxygenase large terminal subunit